MSVLSPSNPDPRAVQAAVAIANLERRVKSGANLYYWIAAMSVLNSFIYFVNGGLTFVIGLGITQFIDGFSKALAEDFAQGKSIIQLIGFAISISVAAVFALFGYLGGKMRRWPFIVGMILYGIDALLLLLLQVWLGFGFHLFFLWGIWGGFGALNQLRKIKSQQSIQMSDFPQDIGG